MDRTSVNMPSVKMRPFSEALEALTCSRGVVEDMRMVSCMTEQFSVAWAGERQIQHNCCCLRFPCNFVGGWAGKAAVALEEAELEESELEESELEDEDD